jgi:light-regulated signal transduction histidine kinase (bacteriophytochrome)
MATEVLEQLHTGAPDRAVRWHVQPGLQAAADPRLMRSVLENLLGNAWKFTSRTPDAEIRVGRDGEGAFYVRDNGAGFDLAHAGRLFGTFERLHRQDEFPGSGIGLATVDRAISRQGGRVWA